MSLKLMFWMWWRRACVQDRWSHSGAADEWARARSRAGDASDWRGNMSTTAAAQLNNNEEQGLNGKTPSMFLQGKVGRDPNVALNLLYVHVLFFYAALKRCYATSIVSLRSMAGISSFLLGEGLKGGRLRWRHNARANENEWCGVAWQLLMIDGTLANRWFDIKFERRGARATLISKQCEQGYWEKWRRGRVNN